MLKIKCPHCTKILNVPESYLGKQIKCPSCKQSLTVMIPREILKEPPEKIVRDIKAASFWKDFFDFRTMLFPDLIKFGWLLYVIFALIGIVIIFCIAIYKKESLPALSTITFGFIGLVVTRLICEFSILFFRINETLTEIRQLLVEQQTKKETKK